MPSAGHPSEYPNEPVAENPLVGVLGQHAADRRVGSPLHAYGTLERAFAASGLIAAGGTLAGAVLATHGDGWPGVLAGAAVAVILCAGVGIWAQNEVVLAQRGELARVYATALQGPRRALMDRRQAHPTRLERLVGALGELLESVRLAVLGRDHLSRWATEMRRVVVERTGTAEGVAAALGEDAHAIAAAVNASRRAEAEITTSLGEMQMRAARAAAAASDMAEEAQALTDAVRQVTAQTSQAAALAARLADAAFTTQRGVAAVTDITVSLGQAADQVKSVLQRAEMLGLNAGIEAAKAGESGRGFAVVAGEVKNLAVSGQVTLDTMLQIVRGLKTEAAGMRRTTEVMGEVIHAQNLLGGSLAEAASHQIQSVGRVVQQVEAANAEVMALRDRARSMELQDLGLAAGPAARKAVERLPAHAEAVAQILRDLPQFTSNLSFPAVETD